MIGSLDFCFDNCWPGVDPKTTPEAHRKHLIETFNYLKKMLPRTLIQLVITPSEFYDFIFSRNKKRELHTIKTKCEVLSTNRLPTS